MKNGQGKSMGLLENVDSRGSQGFICVFGPCFV